MTEYRVKVYNDRTVWYNLKGYVHRENGPAIEYTNGSKFWYLNDKFHRVDGPAVENTNGTKEWFLNGKRHRLYGPVIEYPTGYKKWFINGEELTREEFNKLITLKRINDKINSCSGKVVEIDSKKYKLTEV